MRQSNTKMSLKVYCMVHLYKRVKSMVDNSSRQYPSLASSTLEIPSSAEKPDLAGKREGKGKAGRG